MSELTREQVEKYFKGQGRPDADESWYEEFLNAGDKQNIYNEIVLNDYDLSDVDRWFHLMKVMGVDMSYETAMAINNALWEVDIETLELNTAEENLAALHKKEDSIYGSYADVKSKLIQDYHRNDASAAEILLSKAPDISIEDAFQLYSEVRSEIDGDSIIYFKSSGEIYDIGRGEELNEFELKNIVGSYFSNYIITSAEEDIQTRPAIAENHSFEALRGEISNLKHELNGALAHDPDLVSGLDKRLMLRTLELNAAEAGVELDLNYDDIIDSEHLNCFWYGGVIGTMKYKEYEVVIKVCGDVSIGLFESAESDNLLLSYSNKNNSGAFNYPEVNALIKNDESLEALCKSGRISWQNNNWVEFVVYDEFGKEVFLNGEETVLGDNVLEPFFDVSHFVSILDAIRQQEYTVDQFKPLSAVINEAQEKRHSNETKAEQSRSSRPHASFMDNVHEQF